MNFQSLSTITASIAPALNAASGEETVKSAAPPPMDTGKPVAEPTTAPNLINNNQASSVSNPGTFLGSVLSFATTASAAMPILNAVPSNLTTTSSIQLTLQTPPSSQSPSHPSSAPYEGFAFCQNCGHKGVKAAFYGKSKLFCSMSCQNGIKKQQTGTTATATTTTTATTATLGSLKRSADALSTLTPSQSGSSGAGFSLTSSLSSFSVDLSVSNASNDGATASQQTESDLSPNGANENGADSSYHNKLSAESLVVQSSKRLRTMSTASTNSQMSNMESGSESNAARSLSSSAKMNSSSNGARSGEAAAGPPSRSNSSSCENRICPNLSKSGIMIDKHHDGKAFSNGSFSWTNCLDKENAEAAPISAFKHCVLASTWERLAQDPIVFEVPMRNVPTCVVEYFRRTGHASNTVCYWFAHAVKFAGYFVKLRYFGFDEDAAQDFWMHICDMRLHNVRWSYENEIPIVPPAEIFNKYENWNGFLVNKLINYKSLPKKFHWNLRVQMKSTFEPGKYLELVDKLKISQMRLAKILENVGGRVHLEYEDDGDDFWCHQNSEIIHPIGWSVSTGHDIVAPKNSSALSNALEPSRFQKPRPCPKSANKQFRVNMKLEAIDPLNLSAICVASVVKVLKNDYIMIKIDGYRPDDSDMFCYSRTSSMIFPAGFCQKHNLPLQPPYGYQGEFNWETYLRESNAEFAPADLFWTDENFKNPFKVGMKLESVDLMNPQKICGGTVVAVVNRLIRVNFDGWGKEYDQWMDCESCDIYPIGWCQLNNYFLEPPKQALVELAASSKKKAAKPRASKKTISAQLP